MNAPIGEGMNGVEVERRLNQPVSFSYMLFYQMFHVIRDARMKVFFYLLTLQDDKHIIDMVNNPMTSNVDIRADASQLPPPVSPNVTGPKPSRNLLPSQSMASYIFSLTFYLK